MITKSDIKILRECREKGFERTAYRLDQYNEVLDKAIEALELEYKIGYCNDCGNETCKYNMRNRDYTLGYFCSSYKMREVYKIKGGKN